jgi:hypothetical protein
MMTLHKVLGLDGSSIHGDSGHWTPGKWVGALALAFAMLALAGCGTGTATGSAASQGPAATKSGALVGTAAPSATDQALNDDIPAGRSFAEGSGGLLSYTFREEWRRALAEAQKWRGGAYLIAAVGREITDVGVSEWRLDFIDKADADAVLLVDIHPWGKVIQTQEVTGDGVISFANQYTKRISYAIIDSDKAVGLGKAALASQYPLAKTKEPSLTLDFSRIDGSGPYWTYMLFYESTAEYVSAQIDALTGEVTPPQ